METHTTQNLHDLVDEAAVEDWTTQVDVAEVTRTIIHLRTTTRITTVTSITFHIKTVRTHTRITQPTVDWLSVEHAVSLGDASAYLDSIEHHGLRDRSFSLSYDGQWD